MRAGDSTAPMHLRDADEVTLSTGPDDKEARLLYRLQQRDLAEFAMFIHASVSTEAHPATATGLTAAESGWPGPSESE